MSKTYRDWSTDQTYLFPPSPHDWLPEGDLVYFLLDTVATLDLAPIFAHYERELRGQPPFHPRMMVALLLYCYATGTRSSRRIMISGSPSMLIQLPFELWSMNTNLSRRRSMRACMRDALRSAMTTSRAWTTIGSPKSAVDIWDSSFNRTTCCRNTRSWKTSRCRWVEPEP